MVSVHQFSDPTEMGASAAAAIMAEIDSSMAKTDRFSLALSGGSSPIPLYQELAKRLTSSPHKASVDFFFSDERMVPLEHEYANYRMAKENLFDPADLVADQIFPVESLGRSAEKARAAFEGQLRSHFRTDEPVFDLILLGLGPDGHTASLFPYSPALDHQGLVGFTPQVGLAPHVPRLTFTFRLINHARRVIFYVNGKGKMPVLRSILEGNGGSFPAARVQLKGNVDWYVLMPEGESL